MHTANRKRLRLKGWSAGTDDETVRLFARAASDPVRSKARLDGEV